MYIFEENMYFSSIYDSNEGVLLLKQILKIYSMRDQESVMKNLSSTFDGAII